MRLDGEQHKRAGRSPERRLCLLLPELLRALLARQRGGRHDAHRLRDLWRWDGLPLHPLTRAACTWVAEHLPVDAIRFGNAVAVEWRSIGAIVGGAIGAGLVVR